MGFRGDDVDVEKQPPARRGFILNEIQLIHPTKYDSPLIEEVYKGFQHMFFFALLKGWWGKLCNKELPFVVVLDHFGSGIE